MRKAIVMAGGQGSRLWPLTLSRPKPLVPVANRPVLTHILEWLRRHNVAEVLLTLHYRAEEIRRAFGDGRDFGLRLTYRIENKPMGTAGSVKNAEEWVGHEPFLIVSGDALTDLDLAVLCRHHRERGACLTLGLKQVQDPSAYGIVALDHRERVVRFQEKPGPEEAFSDLANTGIYCVEPQVLQCVPPGRACDWSRDIFPHLMAQGRPLFGHVLSGYWCDIGSISDYRRGQRDALAEAVRVALPAVALRPGVWVGPNARIAPGAVIRGPVLLGVGCRIERDAQVLAGSVIGERAVVRAGACVEGAIVGARCQVGPGAILQDCVLDDEVRVGTASVVCQGAVIGRGCRVAASARIGDGQRIGPGQVIVGARADTHPRLLPGVDFALR